MVQRVRAVAAMRSRTSLRHELQVFQKLFFFAGFKRTDFPVPTAVAHAKAKLDIVLQFQI